MITGVTDKGAFIIGTPTKCATTTIEALARRHVRNNDGAVDFRLMDWDAPRRQHRMALPPPCDWVADWRAARRYLLVRNPYRRYMSVYEYLRAPQNYSQWGARAVQGREWPGLAENAWGDDDPMTFGEFLLWIADTRRELERRGAVKRGELTEGRAYRSPWVWTDSLADSLAHLTAQPAAVGAKKKSSVSLIRLENLEEDLGRLARKFGIEGGRWGGLRSNRTVRPHLGTPAEVWGVKGWCSSGVFGGAGGKQFDGGAVNWDDDCVCPPCQIGVGRESVFLTYV